MYRLRSARLQVMLGHAGGPFWERRDYGAWTIPKGEADKGEDPLAAALREFAEETGFVAEREPVSLGSVRQGARKLVVIWAVQGDPNLAEFCSNTFELEWPRGSGQIQAFPEVDRVEWFELGTARAKIMRPQIPFLDRLVDAVGHTSGRSFSR